MDQTFTNYQCLRLLYGELGHDEAIMLSDLVRDIPELKASFIDMVKAKKVLDSISFQAPVSTVDKILTYSKANNVQMSV